MVTQVIFKIDSKLKKEAQIKARKVGISLSDIYKSATRSFIDGRLDVGLIYYGTLTPNAKTGRELRQSDRDIKAGRGLSPIFTDMDKMDNYLRNLK